MTRIISPFTLIQGREDKDIFNRNSNFSSLEGKAWALMVLRAHTFKYSIKHHGQNTNTWAV